MLRGIGGSFQRETQRSQATRLDWAGQGTTVRPGVGGGRRLLPLPASLPLLPFLPSWLAAQGIPGRRLTDQNPCRTWAWAQLSLLIRSFHASWPRRQTGSAALPCVRFVQLSWVLFHLDLPGLSPLFANKTTKSWSRMKQHGYQRDVFTTRPC